MYLHVFVWPENGKLSIPFTNKTTKAWLMADPKTVLKVIQGKENVAIQLPTYPPDTIASVVALQFEGAPSVLPIPSQGKNVIASSSEEKIMAANLTDGDPKTQWKAAKVDIATEGNDKLTMTGITSDHEGIP
jgi:alpha-L-fucosidase